MLKKNCPSCGQESVYGEHAHFPFCSARCRDKDFIAWAKDERRISTPLYGIESELFDEAPDKEGDGPGYP